MALEKIALRDRVAKQYIEDINSILEESLDDEIEKEKYYLMYPIPYQYAERIPSLNMTGCSDIGDAITLTQYENFYLGRNAIDVLEYPELSIVRGSRYNNLDINQLRGGPLAVRGIPQLEDVPSFDINSISVGASYGWLSQQVQQNRAFNFDNTLPDKEIYDEFKCSKKQKITDFSFDFWGGGSPMNLDLDWTTENPKYPRTNDATTNSGYAWHPSVDKRIGGPWYDVAGGVLTEERIDEDTLDRYAHHDLASVLNIFKFDHEDVRRILKFFLINTIWSLSNVNKDFFVRSYCDNREELDHMPEYTPYQEVELFDETGEWFDGW
ncbi:MAG: hypothetical protein H6765_04155 [Candidatus Peribacteria bacterium]|nr:MAG: hypothetical protein H6765_04155 [Candidatus Peribacteria bacterium]